MFPDGEDVLVGAKLGLGDLQDVGAQRDRLLLVAGINARIIPA